MLVPREGAAERVLRDGAELRCRPLFERMVKPLGMDAEDRLLSDRLVRLVLERPDSRLPVTPEERSLPRDRMVAEARELELPRSDSVMRLERSADERVDSDERL